MENKKFSRNKGRKEQVILKALLNYINCKVNQILAKSSRHVKCDNCHYKCKELFAEDHG